MDKITGAESVRYSANLYDGTNEKLSVSLGKAKNYLSSYMSHGATPSATLLARILELSGHRLAILDDRGKPIATITPD
ncbi:hypothetical protein HGI81_06670 [Olsenella sp. KGMB02461]|nr:hypothetical protein [Olsenella sp. KGMB02461]